MSSKAAKNSQQQQQQHSSELRKSNTTTNNNNNSNNNNHKSKNKLQRGSHSSSSSNNNNSNDNMDTSGDTADGGKKAKKRKKDAGIFNNKAAELERQDDAKKARRSNRFQSHLADQPPCSASAAAARSVAGITSRTRRFSAAGRSSMGAEADQDDFVPTTVIVGTSTSLEKKYLRLTSAPDPSVVRPEHILKQSLAMLKTRWRTEPDYAWTCEQLKAIRQDMTVQRIVNLFTIDVYETHARLALENYDLGEFNQCQSQLQTLYRSGLPGCSLEFKAYLILYCLTKKQMPQIVAIMRALSPEEAASPFVQHALAVRACLCSNLINYHQFFRLFASAPNMGGYLMDAFVDRVRVMAMKLMCKAYRPKLAVDFIQSELGFEDRAECLEFLDNREVVFADVNKESVETSRTLTTFSSVVD